MHRIIYVLLIAVAGCTSGEQCSQAYSLEKAGRYERHMKAAKAWELCPTGSPENEEYRFVLLRSSHNTVVVTLVKDRARAALTAARLEGSAQAGPRGMTETRTKLLSQDEFNRVKSLFERADFWNLKPLNQLTAEGQRDAGGTDSRWVLEAANEHRAHAVDRGGNVDGAFREAALYLLEISQIGIDGEVY